MNKIPVLKFVPQFKNVLWGGKRIAEYKGMSFQGDHIGESWELSGVPGYESVISEGPFKGKNLHEIMLSYGKEILGARLFAKYGSDFPLLIKVIDSNDDLSIQVHPDDRLAAERHNCPGKTELWICVDPQPDAYLYTGFNTVLTKEDFIESIRNKAIVDKLRKCYTHKGDVFFLPAGRVHSIGKGNLLIEIQQTSDISYRIYDYDRRDAEGNPRQLHVEESLAAVNFGDVNNCCKPYRIKGEPDREETIADCAYFTTTSVNVCNGLSLDLSSRDSFTILIVSSGEACVTDPDGTETKVPQGSAVLVPASMRKISVKGNCNIITTYIR